LSSCGHSTDPKTQPVNHDPAAVVPGDALEFSSLVKPEDSQAKMDPNAALHEIRDIAHAVGHRYVTGLL